MTACTFQRPDYNYSKPNGPVRKNTLGSAFSTPNDKRGFVMPNFFGVVRIVVSVNKLWGMVWATRKDVRTAEPVFLTTMLHPMRVRTQTVASMSRSGAKTMTATLRAHTAAPTSTQPSLVAIPADRLQSVLGAYNAANLASSYIERGNFAAARRKLTLALAAINQITAEA